MKKAEDGTWVEVEPGTDFIEQYSTYNRTLIGRALFLSKLEEAAEARALVNLDEKTQTEHSAMDVAKSFDGRMVEIICEWRAFLLEGSTPKKLMNKSSDDMVNALVAKVESATRTLTARECDLSPVRNRKRRAEEREDEEQFSPKSKRVLAAIDQEVQSGGPILNDSQKRHTRASAKVSGEKLVELLSPTKGDGSGVKTPKRKKTSGANVIELSTPTKGSGSGGKTPKKKKSSSVDVIEDTTPTKGSGSGGRSRRKRSQDAQYFLRSAMSICKVHYDDYVHLRVML